MTPKVEEHDCIQKEKLGSMAKCLEIIEGAYNANKVAMITITITIFIQVGSFLYLWGGLTKTVEKNTDYVWGTLTTQTTENTRNIDKILSKLELAYRKHVDSLGSN
jgi:hypothetical protein